MYYRGRYSDGGDGLEMASKRQRMIDQGSSYYGASPASSFMYNPNPHPYSYIGQPSTFPVVRLRGIPFDCSEADIAEFLSPIDIVDVLFVRKSGKFTGQAFCVLGYPLQVDFALQRNRQNIGRRYVEVFRSDKHEYYKAVSNEVNDIRSSSPRRVPKARSFDESAEHTGVLRLRGLPFSAGKEDIVEFFKDFVLSEDSIHIVVNSEVRRTGDAFVEFASAEDSKAAMAKDRMTLGNRYIELFPASLEELDEAVSKSRSRSSDEGTEETYEPTNVLRLRGLPFSAGKDDIMDFFKEFELSEESIHIGSSYDGRSTGEAFVEFVSPEDAKAALAKDRMTLGRRYVELFPSSLKELNDSAYRGR